MALKAVIEALVQGVEGPQHRITNYGSLCPGTASSGLAQPLRLTLSGIAPRVPLPRCF